MTVLRRITIGFAFLLFWTLVLAGTGMFVTLATRTWTSDFNTTLARAHAASTIQEASANMIVYGMGAALATESSVRASEDSVRIADENEVQNALKALASAEQGNSDSAAAVQAMKNAFDQCDQELSAVISETASNRDQAIRDINTRVLPLSTQLDDAASTYGDSARELEQTGLNTLRGRSGIALIVMIAVVVLALIGGVVTNISIVRAIGRQLRGAISSLGASSSELLTVASQVAASATQTAASTNQTTATVEEVKQTAMLAHEKAAEVAERSQTMAKNAEFGQTAVDGTVAVYDRIQTQMGVVTEAIERLTEQTHAVGDIITSVNDLAEQSNLLSVNASIEAAKAGDQGKGFTVVAQEVKSLAAQSKQAVAQVHTILNEIRKASAMAVEAAERGRETIDSGRSQVEEAGVGTAALVAAASEVAKSALQISASSRQQLAGMEQISQAIEVINVAGNQSASGTRQVENEVKQLQSLALSLKRLVEAGATA